MKNSIILAHRSVHHVRDTIARGRRFRTALRTREICRSRYGQYRGGRDALSAPQYCRCERLPDLEPGQELARVRVYSYCIHAALSNAIVTIDRPAVTAYAAAHGLRTDEFQHQGRRQ